MVKPFPTYQHLPDGPMTDRDRKQVGSKFWGRGKWDNFVSPHLPKDGTGMSLVDMGCNAGLFLNFATERGFGSGPGARVIGVDSDRASVERGNEWAKANGKTYTIREAKMERCINDLPIVDYTILCNAHYYFTINDWLEYLDKLRLKTRYVIVVTAEKNHVNRCWASADVASIRTYFKDWREVSFVDELPTEGDPDPRRLWSLCFESPSIERAEVEKLDASNHVQDGFYTELGEGKHYRDTRYYRIIRKYRIEDQKRWSERRLHDWFDERVRVYEGLRADGQKVPIIVGADDRILDGNHRYAALRELGQGSVFIRRTA